jgi:hypothetical protein
LENTEKETLLLREGQFIDTIGEGVKVYLKK